MATLKAIPTRGLPDAEIARLLAHRYRDLTEAVGWRPGRFGDPENVHRRIGNLKTPLTEAVRRLKRK